MEMCEQDLIEQWMVQHPDGLDLYCGKWVAISSNGVIASARSLKELVEEKKVDVKKVLVTKAPTIEQSNAIWVL